MKRSTIAIAAAIAILALVAVDQQLRRALPNTNQPEPTETVETETAQPTPTTCTTTLDSIKVVAGAIMKSDDQLARDFTAVYPSPRDWEAMYASAATCGPRMQAETQQLLSSVSEVADVVLETTNTTTSTRCSLARANGKPAVTWRHVPSLGDIIIEGVLTNHYGNTWVSVQAYDGSGSFVGTKQTVIHSDGSFTAYVNSPRNPGRVSIRTTCSR